MAFDKTWEAKRPTTKGQVDFSNDILCNFPSSGLYPLIALDLDLFGQNEALPAVVSIIFCFRRRLPSLLSKHLHIPSNLRQIVLGPDEVFLQGRRFLSVVP